VEEEQLFLGFTRAYAIQGLRALIIYGYGSVKSIIFELFPRGLSARGEYFRAL